LTPLAISTLTITGATATLPLNFTVNASGGIPVYDWSLVSGALPPGVTLDPFTGALTGTPATNGTFNFSLRLRDYHENAPGVTNSFVMTVAPAPPFSLALSVTAVGMNNQAQLSLSGTTGQRQVIQTSSNLSLWTSLTTNIMATNLFRLTETNASQHDARFYRAVVNP
jgi:hypothetical protein